MRYNKPIYFQCTVSYYDYETGDYTTDIYEDMHYGSICDTDIETAKILFGRLPDGMITVHFQTTFDPMMTARIGDRLYAVEAYRHVMRGTVVYLVEKHENQRS